MSDNFRPVQHAANRVFVTQTELSKLAIDFARSVAGLDLCKYLLEKSDTVLENEDLAKAKELQAAACIRLAGLLPATKQAADEALQNLVELYQGMFEQP